VLSRNGIRVCARQPCPNQDWEHGGIFSDFLITPLTEKYREIRDLANKHNENLNRNGNISQNMRSNARGNRMSRPG
jgi:hypothetical protein